MTIHRWTTSLVGAGLIVIAVPARPTDAAPPDRGHESFTVTGSIDCAVFGEGWEFVDHFVDEFEIDRQYFYDPDGDLVRIKEHWRQVSTDVNSVTGLTINEHNHFLAVGDPVDMTLTISGAMNSAQRRGVGSVIQRTGHKIWELDLTQDPPFGPMLFSAGPLQANDEDFCRALA
jgi:hypothetical protein